jgi:hypothetical protein
MRRLRRAGTRDLSGPNPISHQNNKKHCGKHGKMMQIPHINVERHGNIIPQ